MLYKIINLSYVSFLERELYELSLKKTLMIFFLSFGFLKGSLRKERKKMLKNQK